MIHDNNPYRITRAREAAEAIFTPKRQIANQIGSDRAQSPTRIPRVLPALKSTAIRSETVCDVPSAADQPEAPEISAKAARYIRTLTRYGMTVAQVAGMYGVPVDTIARIVRKS